MQKYNACVNQNSVWALRIVQVVDSVVNVLQTKTGRCDIILKYQSYSRRRLRKPSENFVDDSDSDSLEENNDLVRAISSKYFK